MRVERARLMVVEQDVLLQAVTVYTDLLAARAVLDFANQNYDRLSRQLQATRDRFDVGEVTRTDVAQADARLSGSIADRVEAEGAVAAAVASYRRVINQEPAGLVVPPPLSLLPTTEDEAQQLGENLNPNIAAAQYNLAAARADVDVAEAALLPRLSVRGEYAYARDPQLALDWQRDASIGATLSVPLYQGGGEYARVRQNKQTVRQRRDDVEDTLRAVRDEVTNSWETLVTATSRIEFDRGAGARQRDRGRRLPAGSPGRPANDPGCARSGERPVPVPGRSGAGPARSDRRQLPPQGGGRAADGRRDRSSGTTVRR